MPYAQLSSVRQHYVDYGDGPERVVFVHGFQASARIWQLVQERLPVRMQSIAVNNRGAGETTALPSEDAYGCGPFASDLFELVQQLGWRDFTLVGHSMGGATVMQFAVDHPELLKGLVLLDPAPPDRQLPPGTDLERMIDERMERRRQQQARGGALSGLVGESAGAPREFLEALAADIDAAPEQRLRGSTRSMATLHLGDRVRRLPMPVLLCGGDADALVPLASMLDTYQKLPPGSGLQIWHGIGHSPNVSCPDDLARVLVRFIEVTIPARSTRQPAAG